MNKYLQLFLSFFKIGAFTFGGGLAMIPIMEHEIVEKRGWIKEEDITDMIAISESTPGVMAVNFATFVGYKIGKFWGSLIATLAVVIPSFIIILIISLFLNAFKENTWIQYFLLGIKSGVVVLLFNAVKKLSKSTSKTIFTILLMLACLIVSLLFEISVLYLLLLGAIIGIVRAIIIEKRGVKNA